MAEPFSASNIHDAVRKKYVEVARSPEGRFTYPTGSAGLAAQGYDPAVVQGLPGEVLFYFTGVGNPFALGPIHPGERVLDVGCGAGFDLIFASRVAGKEGCAVGVDLTTQMVRRAALNIGLARAENAIALSARAEELPFKESAFDVAISNGVLNLSPEKARCFGEILRVLRPGGRLMFADIVVREGVSLAPDRTLKDWSD